MKILLIVYDNESYVSMFPIGLAYISSVLLKSGHVVEIYSQDMHHYPDGHLTQYLDENHFDVVGVSVIGGYYQYRKLMELSNAINKSVDRPYYIIGGHGPAPEPEYFFKKTLADAIIIGEGEDTIVELLEALKKNTPLERIRGIAYREGDVVKINPRRELIKDIDSIPLPAYHIFPMNYYRLGPQAKSGSTDFTMTILSGRGCSFSCNFCFRLDKGLRIRSDQSIIEEIKFLNKTYGINYIAFYDELLMCSKERSIKLSESIINSGLKIKWCCNGRLNYVTQDALEIMKKAGCVFINYGIESFDDNVLRNMNKHLTEREIVSGVEATINCGISPGLNIIWGNIGDTKETLEKGVNFLLKYDDGALLRTIRPVTPYPGCPLYYYAIEKGLLKDIEDFYENRHINSDLLTVNFTNLSDKEYYDDLMNANNKLIQKYFDCKLHSILEDSRNLYLNKNINFRGFRPV